MNHFPTYPVVLLPSTLQALLEARPPLPVFPQPVPEAQAFPPEISVGKSLVTTLYGLLRLTKAAEELTAPERQAAKVRYEAALRAHEAQRQAFEELEAAKLTPEVLWAFRRRKVAAFLEASAPDSMGESFAPAGAAEKHLLRHLIRHFPNNILRRRVLGRGRQAYHPDFVYFDPAHRLRIDIELDEPYSMGAKLPIHYVELADDGQTYRSSDDQRNGTFLAAGWPIIRFSEQQAVEDPEGCARVVADVVERLTGQGVPGLGQVLPVSPHPRWLREEANAMASSRSRDDLLRNVEREEDKPPPRPPRREFVPSPYQRQIFDFLEQENGHGLVIAVAGSGKSTTLLEATKVIKRNRPQARVVLLAFNTSIAEELAKKLQDDEVIGVETATLNGFGHRLLGKRKPKPELTPNKPAGMIQQAAWELWGRPLAPDERQSAVKLYGLFQSYIWLDPAHPDHFRALAEQYDLRDTLELQEVVARALALGEERYKASNLITFDDQNYLPVRLQLQVEPYDFVFVDECQDLTQTQLEMVQRIAGERGRLLFVGDPQQAIMGFRGADNDSVENIRRLPKPPKELPLTVCYRCPQSHVRLARELMPAIEAAPGAKEGEVYHVGWDQAFEYVRERDLLFARNNALVDRVVLELLARGIPLDYEDKRKERAQGSADEDDEDNERVRRVVEELRKAAPSFDPLTALHARPVLGRKAKVIEALLPWVLGRLHEQARQWDEGEFPAFVEAMTNPDRYAGVRVSSAHKAKGLEAERVFVMGYGLFEKGRPGDQAWVRQQERNLRYVALTRAKDTLYLVREP